MRRTWAGRTLWFALLLATVGCYSTDRKTIKAPKHDEVYALPPADDAKWDKPLEYPKGTLNKDTIKPREDPGGPGKAGAGMGGPSMGASRQGGGH